MTRLKFFFAAASEAAIGHLDAGHVERDRLLDEDVLAGVDGGLEHDGMEMRRAGDHHHVDVALDHLLVGVETDEAMLVIDDHLLGIHLLQLLAAAGQVVGEDVGHGHQADVLAGVHGVGGRSATPPAAADKPTLMTSLPAAWAPRPMLKGPASAAPPSRAEVRRKSRREGRFVRCRVSVSA